MASPAKKESLGKKSAVPEPQLGAKELQVLKELASGTGLLRTRTSVARETGIEKPEVNAIMSKLAHNGLVGNQIVVTVTGARRRHWFITEIGTLQMRSD